ncbi:MULTISPECIES: RNA polymerase sigma factor [unclassified Variovorax]|uniref:RNA polymerase sigma factor n=1 Tax=unclassified Variovorax TaxID=663243 RepID=UPI003F458EA5
MLSLSLGSAHADDLPGNSLPVASGVFRCLRPTPGTEAANDSLGQAHHGFALQDFLVANYERLRQRLLHRVGCAHMASDCLHDTWLRLGETVVCEPVHSPERYVYRVACNVAIDYLRANRPWQYSGDAEAVLEQLVDPSPGPETIAQARSELHAVDRAIERMPRRHRAVLMSLRIDEMTRDEVATRYGLSLRGVDTVLRQALDHCAKGSGQQVFAGISAVRRQLRAARSAL